MLSTTTISAQRSRISWATMREPMNPAPPVTKIFFPAKSYLSVIRR